MIINIDNEKFEEDIIVIFKLCDGYIGLNTSEFEILKNNSYFIKDLPAFLFEETNIIPLSCMYQHEEYFNIKNFENYLTFMFNNSSNNFTDNKNLKPDKFIENKILIIADYLLDENTINRIEIEQDLKIIRDQNKLLLRYSNIENFKNTDYTNHYNIVKYNTINGVDYCKKMKYLIDNYDVNINYQNNYGETALMLASRDGYIDKVKTLLQYSQINPDIRNNCGNTAVTLARKYHHSDIIKIIYEK